jgi:hypothetical protein
LRTSCQTEPPAIEEFFQKATQSANQHRKELLLGKNQKDTIEILKSEVGQCQGKHYLVRINGENAVWLTASSYAIKTKFAAQVRITFFLTTFFEKKST